MAGMKEIIYIAAGVLLADIIVTALCFIHGFLKLRRIQLETAARLQSNRISQEDQFIAVSIAQSLESLERIESSRWERENVKVKPKPMVFGRLNLDEAEKEWQRRSEGREDEGSIRTVDTAPGTESH